MDLSSIERINPYKAKFDSMHCLLCGYVDNAKLFGDFFVSSYEKLCLHQHCLYFSSAVEQVENTLVGFVGFAFSCIKEEIKRGKSLKCFLCKYKMATIGCSIQSCRVNVHFPCAIKNRYHFRYAGDFSMKCHKHRPLFPSLDHKASSWSCPICFESIHFDDRTSYIVLPCCKTSACHFDCLQNQALNSGYFFRCPLCSDKDIFIPKMVDYGLYIPQRDVTWEDFAQPYSPVNCSNVSPESSDTTGIESPTIFNKTEDLILSCSNPMVNFEEIIDPKVSKIATNIYLNTSVDKLCIHDKSSFIDVDTTETGIPISVLCDINTEITDPHFNEALSSEVILNSMSSIERIDGTFSNANNGKLFSYKGQKRKNFKPLKLCHSSKVHLVNSSSVEKPYKKSDEIIILSDEDDYDNISIDGVIIINSNNNQTTASTLPVIRISDDE